MAPNEKTELRGMNAFTSVRPRGEDAPAKLPTKKAGKLQLHFTSPSKVRGETRVLNAAGKWQAYLEPARNSIVIESREQSQASNDKTRAITRGLS